MTRPAQAHTVLLLLLLAATVPAAAVPSPAHALLAWKASLGDPAALSSWTDATAVGHWHGVACDAAGRITSLSLRNLGLSGGLGALNPWAFPSLAVLDLNGNQLAGHIPANLSLLRSLVTLDLGSNQLEGSIPPQLGNLSSLAALDLNNNNFSGHITASLSRLRSLATLDLGNNMFDGPIPPQLGDLSGLVDLRLCNNNLVGDIPHQLTRLPRIQHFDLGSNFLTNPPGYRGFSPMPTVRFMSLYVSSSAPRTEQATEDGPATARPNRLRKLPARLAGQEWAM